MTDIIRGTRCIKKNLSKDFIKVIKTFILGEKNVANKESSNQCK